MANPTTYANKIRCRAFPDNVTGSASYTPITAYNTDGGHNFDGSQTTAAFGWRIANGVERWAMGELGNLRQAPVTQGVQTYDILAGLNNSTNDSLQIIRQSRGQGADMYLWSMGVGPYLRFGLKTLNRIAVGFNTTALSPLVNGSTAAYLPASPVPVSFGITTGGSTYTATARVYGWPTVTLDSADKSAAFGATSFCYYGGRGDISAGSYRGGLCDGPNFYSAAVSASDWNDYKGTWAPSRVTLHSLTPSVIVVHIGTSRTDGFYTFGDDTYVGRLAQRYIASQIHYNWGWPGVDAATLATNVALYTAAITALKNNFPSARIVVIIDCGANDAGADGRVQGSVPSTSAYDASLATLCSGIRAVTNCRLLKLTSTPFCYPNDGSADATALQRQTNLDGFNAKDRTSRNYDGILDIARDPAFTLADGTIGTLKAMCGGTGGTGASNASTYYQTGSNTAATIAATNYDGIHGGQNWHAKVDTFISGNPTFNEFTSPPNGRFGRFNRFSRFNV